MSLLLAAILGYLLGSVPYGLLLTKAAGLGDIRAIGSGIKGHFMDPNLLRSQFEALEVPEGTLQVDVTPAPEVIASEIRRKIGL